MEKLKNLGTLFTGNTPTTSDIDNYSSDDICFVKPGDISGNGLTRLSSSDFYISEYARKKARILPANSVLVTCIGIIGKVALNSVECAFNQQINAIVPDENKCIPEYLAYALIYRSPQLRVAANSAVVPILNKSQFAEIEIPVPTLDTQMRIVRILKKAEQLISFYEKQMLRLDDLIKARFVEMFGERGKQVPLTDYVWFQEGPGVRSADFTSEGTILLTGTNINDNEISFGYKGDRHISNELATGKYAHFMCDKDDILVVSSAIDPERFDKKVAIVKEDGKYCLNTGIIRFKPNCDVLTLGYFREFLKTDFFKHQVIAEMRGIAQMHFGPSHLKKMTILLPSSLDQQTEFEQFVQQVDKSKLAVQKALDEAQMLFDSLMQQHFG